MRLLRFCFTTLSDWFEKLAPPAQPIRCHVKTNHDLVARRVPALSAGYMYLLQVLIGSLCCFRLFYFGFGFTTTLN